MDEDRFGNILASIPNQPQDPDPIKGPPILILDVTTEGRDLTPEQEILLHACAETNDSCVEDLIYVENGQKTTLCYFIFRKSMLDAAHDVIEDMVVNVIERFERTRSSCDDLTLHRTLH